MMKFQIHAIKMEEGIMRGTGLPVAIGECKRMKISKKIKENRKNTLLLFLIWAIFCIFRIASGIEWTSVIQLSVFGFFVTMIIYIFITTTKKQRKKIFKDEN